MSEATLISTCSELEALLSRRSRARVQRVFVALDGNRAQIRDAETRINKHLHSCGCTQAAMLVAGVLLASLGIVSMEILDKRTVSGAELGYMAACLIGASILGKLLGIAYGERELASALRDAISACRCP